MEMGRSIQDHQKVFLKIRFEVVGKGLASLQLSQLGSIPSDWVSAFLVNVCLAFQQRGEGVLCEGGRGV